MRRRGVGGYVRGHVMVENEKEEVDGSKGYLLSSQHGR
jgi:hypothetical protein